ncbi:hypothetical protein, partial [Salinarimonas sp.]|uniref:hypothetical protein n=1 Tax=Salinarimonas sp. TaxID=2766526 RepID=UPI00391A0A7F
RPSERPVLADTAPEPGPGERAPRDVPAVPPSAAALGLGGLALGAALPEAGGAAGASSRREPPREEPASEEPSREESTREEPSPLLPLTLPEEPPPPLPERATAEELASEAHAEEQPPADELPLEMPPVEIPPAEEPAVDEPVDEPVAEPARWPDETEPREEPPIAALAQTDDEAERLEAAPADRAEAALEPPPEEPLLASAEAAPEAPSPEEPPPEEPLSEEPVIVGTYSSGANTYTMYSDGSIEADTPDGKLWFASLDELKGYIASAGEDPSGASVSERP